MSDRQTMEGKLKALYAYIKDYAAAHGYPPSVREMCRDLKINSTATAFYYINKLADVGLLTKSSGRKRAIQLNNKYRRDSVEIPLVGRITAGVPIAAEENLEDVFTLPDGLFGGGGELFMLNVSGDSMINAGILSGDKIVVRRQPICENGAIVAAMIDGEATVKRFFKEKNRVRLQPENDSMQPIYSDRAEVLGVVVGLIRNL